MTGAGVGVIIYSSSPLLLDEFIMLLAIFYFAIVVLSLVLSVIYKIDYKN